MSVNSKIINALSPLGYPVKPNEYTGSAATYFTFNYSTHGVNYNDDEPGHEMNLIQVHFICPVNSDCLSTCKDVKKRLFEAGFTYPSMLNVGYDDISNKATIGRKQHYVFECELAEGVDLDGTD